MHQLSETSVENPRRGSSIRIDKAGNKIRLNI
jgi:hypothetical protein